MNLSIDPKYFFFGPSGTSSFFWLAVGLSHLFVGQFGYLFLYAPCTLTYHQVRWNIKLSRLHHDVQLKLSYPSNSWSSFLDAKSETSFECLLFLQCSQIFSLLHIGLSFNPVVCSSYETFPSLFVSTVDDAEVSYHASPNTSLWYQLH